MGSGRVKRIEIPYAPRDAFRAYHASDKRFRITIAHRRAGKTVARINRLLRAALEFTQERGRFHYVAPTYGQAEDIAWAFLLQYTQPLRELGLTINKTDLSITLPHNGALIRLYGAENADVRMRGLHADGVSIDEAQDIPPAVYTQVIRPSLADRRGWLDVAGTPKGRAGLLYALKREAEEHRDDWHIDILKASDTGLLDPDELAHLQRTMPANEYAQEFECSFDAAITGAYYASDLTKLEEQNRITSVIADPALPVHVAWDLGIGDATALWFAQATPGGEIRLIDYYEASGNGIDHYVRVLQERGYTYGDQIVPHDVQVRELGTGKSRMEVMQSLGLRNLRVAPNVSVEDGINAARMLLPRCWFDKARCAQGVEYLRMYRVRRDEKRGVSFGPLHDATSHCADAFRYLALALREHTVQKQRRERVSVSWMGS